jgi:eukaryotic-like serine/threonine-protein kinase
VLLLSRPLDAGYRGGVGKRVSSRGGSVAPDVIAGRYRVLRAVGRGGMGAVWLCSDDRLGRDVALKQVGLLPGEETADVARALREARTLAVLNHRNVVTVYDTVDQQDRFWLVM